jgi:hypothetical protein
MTSTRGSAPGASPHSATPEQEAIISAIATTSTHILVEAGAGCAKTTTAKAAARGIKEGALALAFNKRIAMDLAEAMPSHFHCKTFNGLGHGAWARACGSTKLTLDDRKLGKLVSQIAQARRVVLNTDQWDGLRQLVQKAMGAGLVPAASGPEGFTPDTREGWESVADSMGMFADDFDLVWELGREILVENIKLARDGIISFDDQVYCPTMLGGRFTKYPNVIVDEDQDLSDLNIAMLDKSARGRIIALGDKRQAIYAWRGARGDSAQRIRGLRPGAPWAEFPLLTTFRCPQVVVERQQAHLPGFRAAPEAPEGAVYNWLGEAHWTWEALRTTGAGSIAILCRNNAPIMKMAWALLRRGVGVQIIGRDIGRGLLALVRKIAPDDTTGIGPFLAKLASWEEGEISKARANGKAYLVSGILDRAEALRASACGASPATSGALCQLILELFSRTTGTVTLSSIHRAKGLEWTTVVHLDPWRIPSKFALAEGEEALAQEMNLRYVAETRTRETLILANADSFGG